MTDPPGKDVPQAAGGIPPGDQDGPSADIGERILLYANNNVYFSVSALHARGRRSAELLPAYFQVGSLGGKSRAFAQASPLLALASIWTISTWYLTVALAETNISTLFISPF